MENLRLERAILSSKDFSRLKDISLAVDKVAQKDTAQNRQSHSFEVANTIEIMNQMISLKLGFDLDPRKLGRSIGLLHDIGHMAFGHVGEKVLNTRILEISGNRVPYEGNSNNYKKLNKNKILQSVSLDTKRYVLASLAKHPETLYKEQEYIKKYIKIETKKELRYLREFMEIDSLSKTIQCQVMDIADENSYIISDLVDSMNVIDNSELREIFSKELPFNISKKLNKVIDNKANFRRVLNDLFYEFCDNFTLTQRGVIEPISIDIENVRLKLAYINREYLLKHSTIQKIRKREVQKINIIVDYFFKHTDSLPSKYYSKKMKFIKSHEEVLMVIRDFIGGMTDKGLKKELRKIKAASL